MLKFSEKRLLLQIFNILKLKIYENCPFWKTFSGRKTRSDQIYSGGDCPGQGGSPAVQPIPCLSETMGFAYHSSGIQPDGGQ